MNPGRAGTRLTLICVFLVAACGQALPATPLPHITSTLPAVTNTPHITATASILPGSTEVLQDRNCLGFESDECTFSGSLVFSLPVVSPAIDTIDRSYPFGGTMGGSRDPHHGVEFYNGSGTPVLAAADGQVVFAGNDSNQMIGYYPGMYGLVVILKHATPTTPYASLFSLYAHLSLIEVTLGQSVTGGEKIGEVGLSGSAIGSHLHFEVRTEPMRYSSSLNPELWLMPHPGNGSLGLQAVDHAGASLSPTFTVQYFPDRALPAAASFELASYNPELKENPSPWHETAVLGDQPAGWYRITFYWQGAFYERWMQVLAGKLTLERFQVK
jgi:hypothetical protein